MTQALTVSHPLDGLRQSAARARARARALWHTYPRELVGVGLLGLVAVGALGTSMMSNMPASHSAKAAPPAAPPMLVRPIAPDQALKLNAEVPISASPNPAALPFTFRGSAEARAQALNCLASAVYYEAGNQDENGERAVAQVVLNRVRHPAFPSSVCGVVYEGSTKPTGCQFTFTCDGSLSRRPDADGWRRAMQVAEDALSGSVYAPIGWATHYHADYVIPYWAATMAKNAVVGAHLFYRWAGTWGQPGVFTQGYSGREPNAAALRAAALAAPHVTSTQSRLAQEIKNIPGAEPLKLSPSMRGDKRVAVRFNLVARKAADTAVHEDYDKKFDVSDNLKWSLSGESVAENEQPLGRPAAPAKTTAQSAGSAVTSAAR
jgi:spore germination cell wall hydrolase CwlJ-like protein